MATAQRNWLRAMNYYSAAAMPLDQADDRLISLIKTHGKWVDPR